jgi:hypothetical protein
MARLQCTYAQAHAAAEAKVGQGYRTKEWQYECWIDGEFQFKVTIPDAHGRRNAHIPKGTLSAMLKQLQLTRDEFALWRDCPMGQEQYELLMRQKLGLQT